jgi:hypothetical protein
MLLEKGVPVADVADLLGDDEKKRYVNTIHVGYQNDRRA